MGESVSGLGDLFGGVDPDGLDVEQLRSQLADFTGAAAQSAQRMAIETADAWSKDDLAHVWVNAQGVVIQVEFDDRLFAEATGADAGAAVVQAAQAAAAKMRTKTDEFQAALWQRVSQFGVRPIDEIEEFKAMHPQVPLSGPGSRERRVLAEEPHATFRTAHADPHDWQPTIRDTD
jgi:DNA-binding protein YbaB